MSDAEHGISTQAYICPVCFDDHSTGPHRFTDAELAARDAGLRAEIAAQIRASCSDKTTCESCEADAAIAEGRP